VLLRLRLVLVLVLMLVLGLMLVRELVKVEINVGLRAVVRAPAARARRSVGAVTPHGTCSPKKSLGGGLARRVLVPRRDSVRAVRVVLVEPARRRRALQRRDVEAQHVRARRRGRTRDEELVAVKVVGMEVMVRTRVEPEVVEGHGNVAEARGGCGAVR
jgi:hypothetical protein